MTPTDILSEEHRVIEQVLGCLEKMAERSRSEGRLDRRAAKDAIAFFRTFADRCHHGKEEAQLFPAMEAKGFSPDCGPTAVMRREHELGRAHVRAMDEAIDAAAAGDAEALARFAGQAVSYIRLLREHIDKEDHCLFTAADRAFTAEDQRELMAAFERAEAEETGEGTHETYLQLANDLADRFGVARAFAEHPGCGCHPC